MSEDAAMHEVPKPAFINGMVLQVDRGKDFLIPIQYQSEDGTLCVLEILPVDAMALATYLSIAVGQISLSRPSFRDEISQDFRQRYPDLVPLLRYFDL